jgi:hypothetical protein
MTEFASVHPILTVMIVVLAYDLIDELIKAFKARGSK